MHFTTILILGLVGGANMLLILKVAERLHVGTSDLLQSLVGFLIPKSVRNRSLTVGMHFLIGIGVAGAYAFLLKAVGTAGFAEYLGEGALLGFVHGFFVSVFFAAATLDKGAPIFHAPAAAISVAAHVAFGLTVGAGLAFAEASGTPNWFALFNLAALALIVGLGSVSSELHEEKAVVSDRSRAVNDIRLREGF